MRRGFWKDLSEAIGAAKAMAGCGHPDDIDDNRAALDSLHKEIKKAIKAGEKLDRNMAAADGRIGKQEYT